MAAQVMPDEDDDAFLRRVTRDEEWILAHYPEQAGGPWRWFRSPNVVDLLKVKRIKTVSPPPSPKAT
jgi:hypothetical protein